MPYLKAFLIVFLPIKLRNGKLASGIVVPGTSARLPVNSSEPGRFLADSPVRPVILLLDGSDRHSPFELFQRPINLYQIYRFRRCRRDGACPRTRPYRSICSKPFGPSVRPDLLHRRVKAPLDLMRRHIRDLRSRRRRLLTRQSNIN